MCWILHLLIISLLFAPTLEKPSAINTTTETSGIDQLISLEGLFSAQISVRGVIGFYFIITIHLCYGLWSYKSFTFIGIVEECGKLFNDRNTEFVAGGDFVDRASTVST